MTVIKSKSVRGIGKVTLEQVTVTTIAGVKHTGYVIKSPYGGQSAIRKHKKDALAFFRRECVRVFG